VKIVDGDPFSSRPYENLLPILDALVVAGNVALDGGFVLHQDGWRGRVAKPIDVDLVDRLFQLPRSIRVSRAHDTILDESTWVSIEGPGAIPKFE
jgi:hypothetical protein